MRASNNRRPRGGRPNSGSNHSSNNQGRSGNNNSARRSNNNNRNFDSNGPDGKIRGTASQVFEKYISLATDTQISGDHVAAENYFQHAEHYFRIVAAANQAQQEKQAEQQARQAQHEASQQTQPVTPAKDHAAAPMQSSQKKDMDVVPAPDLSEMEQPGIEAPAVPESAKSTETVDASMPQSDAVEEEEKPKRRVSRTRTLRRRTSSRSEEKEGNAEVDTTE